MKPSNAKVIDLLNRTNPRLCAELYRDLAIDAASQQGYKVDYLKTQLEAETDRLKDLRETASAAKDAFDREFPADGSDARPMTLGDTFHARKNGIPQSDRQSNFGQY